MQWINSVSLFLLHKKSISIALVSGLTEIFFGAPLSLTEKLSKLISIGL